MLPPHIPRSDAPDEYRSELDEARRVARTSNLVAVAALMLSACALVTSFVLARGGGDRSGSGASARLVAEAPASKELSPDVTYARLPGLAIYQDNLAADAVGTPELQDASVTAAKLATGAVTADKLAVGAVSAETLAAGAVSSAALSDEAISAIQSQVSAGSSIFGEVTEEGVVGRGSGFTAAKISTGQYRIEFEADLAEPAVLVAVANSYGKCCQWPRSSNPPHCPDPHS